MVRWRWINKLNYGLTGGMWHCGSRAGTRATVFQCSHGFEKVHITLKIRSTNEYISYQEVAVFQYTEDSLILETWDGKKCYYNMKYYEVINIGVMR